jgi:hypothetical protein
MDKEKCIKFLKRIVKDPDFRKRLQSEPVRTLKRLGVIIPPNHVPKGRVKLPSNKEITDNLEKIAAELAGANGNQFDRLWRGQ